MGLNQRIKAKCLECSGDSSKEVSLCHIFDCPLWHYRTGTTTRSKTYKRRMELAFKNYPEEIEELKKMGIDIGKFLGS